MEQSMNIELRLEKASDYAEVERITRDAFWNLHAPGCDEHYLAHAMRSHPDFIADLDYVATVDGKVVGNIMYTRASLVSSSGAAIPIATFGPVSVDPAYQRRGVGTALIDKTVAILRDRDVAAIVIWGNPKNYVRYGFKNCKDYNVSIMENKFPACLLVLELSAGSLGKEFLEYRDSEVYLIDKAAAEAFDLSFEPREKSWCPSQEEFRILSRSWIE
jgi:predicted N-acetyltransferase YhbS